MQWIQEHNSLPREHNKQCLLAERSDKHLFPLMVLEDRQVSVAVFCSFFASPGWWHLALELQRSVDVQQQGASYKEPCVASVVSGFPKTPALCQSPHKIKSPVISRRSNPQLTCVLLPLTPVHPPLERWVHIAQESAGAELDPF